MSHRHLNLLALTLALDLEYGPAPDVDCIVVTALLVRNDLNRRKPFSVELRWNAAVGGFRESRRELVREAGHRIVFEGPRDGALYDVAGYVIQRHEYDAQLPAVTVPAAEYYGAYVLDEKTLKPYIAWGRCPADAQIKLETALLKDRVKLTPRLRALICVDRITQAKDKPAPTCGPDGSITHHGWCESIS